MSDHRPPATRSCPGSPSRTRARWSVRSLEGDLGALALELGLGLLGGLLVDLLQDGLRRGLDASLASLRPRPVSSRTTLMTWIFLPPSASRTTSNSSFSASASAAAAAPPASPAIATGAAAVTSKVVLELLHELGELDQRHLLERVEQLVGAELRHVWRPFLNLLSKNVVRRGGLRPPRRPPSRACPAGRPPDGRPWTAGPGTGPRPCSGCPSSRRPAWPAAPRGTPGRRAS